MFNRLALYCNLTPPSTSNLVTLFPNYFFVKSSKSLIKKIFSLSLFYFVEYSFSLILSFTHLYTFLMSSLDLYILCRDRPEMAVRAIESALSNHLSFVSIFISDNSVSDDIYQLSKNYPSCTYIRRSPCLKSIFEHYKVIISESSSEYICFLHDDDILSSNYLERLVYFLDSDLTISAVACNGIPIYPNLR